MFIYLRIYWGLYVCICFLCVCYFVMIYLRKIYFLRLNIVFLNNYLINGGSSHCEKCQNTDRKKLHTWTFYTQWEIYKLTYRKEMFCHSHEFDPRIRHCSIKLGLNSENSPGASALGPTWGCLQHSSKPSADCFTQQS